MQQQFKNLIKGILIYGFGNVSVKLVGFVLLRLYTNPNILSVEEFATWGVLESTTLIIVSLFSLSLYSAYIRWYWDKEHLSERKNILFSCFVVLLTIGLLLSASGFISSKTISVILFNKDSFYVPIRLMIIGTSLQLIIDLTLSQMRVEEKPTFYITSNLTRLTFTLVATIFLLKYAHHGLNGIYEAVIIGNIAFLIVTSPYIYKNIEIRFNAKVVKEMISYSLPLAIASISGVLLTQFDRFVLNYRSSIINVGVYTLGFKIANMVKLFIVNSIQIALTPTYFKLMNHPDHKAIFSKMMVWLSILVVYASLFLSLFGLELTKIFSKGIIYWEAYKVIPILCLGIVFGTLKDSSLIGLQIVKQTKIIGVVLMGIAIINLGLNLLFIPLFDYTGAAVSSLIAQFLFFVIIYLYAQKHYRIPYRLDKVFTIILIGVIIFIAGCQFNNDSLGIRLLVKGVALILFPILLLVFRIFDSSDVEKIKAFFLSIRSIFISTPPNDIDKKISEIEEA